jgi:hypothetical protein
LLHVKWFIPRSTKVRRFNDAPICVETIVRRLLDRFTYCTHTVFIVKLHATDGAGTISEELKQITFLTPLRVKRSASCHCSILLNGRSSDRTAPVARTSPGFVRWLCEWSIDSSLADSSRFGPSEILRCEF